jgi:hypothetical protein
MMTAVPFARPMGGANQVIVGVSLGESVFAPGALPVHKR